MVAFHMKKLGYNISEMAKLLHLKTTEFQEMYRIDVIGDPPSGSKAKTPCSQMNSSFDAEQA
jgi:hypothetical protein